MGQVIIKLDSLLKSKGVSKNKVCKYCDMQRTQLNRYINNGKRFITNRIVKLQLL